MDIAIAMEIAIAMVFFSFFYSELVGALKVSCTAIRILHHRNVWGLAGPTEYKRAEPASDVPYLLASPSVL